MTRKETTKQLSNLLEQYIDPYNDQRIYWAKEITFDYGTPQQSRVDYMQFKPKNNTVSGIEKGDFYCYEIKSCLSDFQSKHGHNFIGDYNYYVMPLEMYEQVKDKIPHFVGVYVPDSDPYSKLVVMKKSKRHDRAKPIAEMLLMMFRSANRDRRRENVQKKTKSLSILCGTG